MASLANQSIAMESCTSNVQNDHAFLPKILTGSRKNIYLIRMWSGTILSTLLTHPNPIHAFKIIRRLLTVKSQFTFNKLSYVDGRFYFNFNYNGWPSKHFKRPVGIEARQAVNGMVSALENLRIVLIAFTKKCPLFCEHCYEGPELNKKDTLSLTDHKNILKKLQKTGISLFHFGGGEPMTKVNDLIELIDSAEKTADFWIYTSGFNLTKQNALGLKKVGLTGIALSLDHYLPESHNKFRRNAEAYNWVCAAAQNAISAKLVLGLSICVTKEFCTRAHLFNYLENAKALGASFVQLLEPRAVGNYAGQDVSIGTKHELELERFYKEANTDSKYKSYPIVQYPAYHQRRSGCPGAGSNFLYVDTDGYMSSCPFCRNKKTHILDDAHELSIKSMVSEGCAKYPSIN